MQFKQGTDVYTADDNKVGRIDRVVMRPNDNKVTHLVVEKGFLFKTDRVVPVEMVAHTGDDRVVLNSGFSEDDFKELPEFEERVYVPANDIDGTPENEAATYPYYYYGGYGTASGWQFAPPFWSVPNYVSYEAKNIPADTVVLNPGMDIITSDGEDVGSLDDVYVNSVDERITHFTLSKGLIFAQTKAIPVHWINYVDENHIHLVVTKKTIEALPDYEGQPA